MDKYPIFDFYGFKERIIGLGVTTREEIQECTEGEITKLFAKKHEVSVPSAYLQFLSFFGRGVGYLFWGTDIYYPSCLVFNEYAEEFAHDDDPDLATRGRFFFAHHQGYELYFFENDDESVWS